MARRVKILGIDPGSLICGYGLIWIEGSRQGIIDFGQIKLDKALDTGERLFQIYDKISDLIKRHVPDEAAIEQVFLNKNFQSALKLGQARGAAMVALAQYALPISEYSAREIKKSCVGYGNADKNQMQDMIKHLFNLPEKPASDAADAIAVAHCHAGFRSLRLPDRIKT